MIREPALNFKSKSLHLKIIKKLRIDFPEVKWQKVEEWAQEQYWNTLN